jgi:anti-anti-sigma factor
MTLMGLPATLMSHDEFRVDVDHRQRLICILGDLDVATVLLLDDAADNLQSARSGSVTLDFASVTFCGASGLGAVVRIHNRQVVAGERLSLTGMSPQIERVFRVGGLEALLSPESQAS